MEIEFSTCSQTDRQYWPWCVNGNLILTHRGCGAFLGQLYIAGDSEQDAEAFTHYYDSCLLPANAYFSNNDQAAIVVIHYYYY